MMTGALYLASFFISLGVSLCFDQILTCDFSSGSGSLENNYASLCHRIVRPGTKLNIICPRVVGENDDGNVDANEIDEFDIPKAYNSDKEEYVLRPESPTDTAYTYTIVDQILHRRSVIAHVANISDIFGTKRSGVISLGKHDNVTVLTLRNEINNLFVVRDVGEMFYLCVHERYIIDKTALQPISQFMENGGETTDDGEYSIKSTPVHPVKSKMRVGIAKITFGETVKVTHGCGNMPTNLFLNSSHYNEKMDMNICKINVSLRPNVGFYCNGIISPPGCFKRTYDFDSSKILNTPSLSLTGRSPQDHNFIFASFDLNNMPKGFHRICRCLSRQTREISAVIELERITNHVCNITGKVFQHMVKPIIGNWCDLTLHGGDSLKIIFPQESTPSNTEEQGYSLGTLVNPRNIASDVMFTKFSPTSINLLEGKLHQIIGGNAFSVDVTRYNHGEISIRYEENKPLVFKEETGKLIYRFIIHFHPNPELDIVAPVIVRPIPTHKYIKGCEEHDFGTFKGGSGSIGCRNIFDACGGENTRYCRHDHTDTESYGIYCPLPSEIRPIKCGQEMYDGIRSEIVSVDIDKQSTEIDNFRVFYLSSLRHEMIFSLSCSCVNSFGMETTKLVINKFDRYMNFSHPFGDPNPYIVLIPRVSLEIPHLGDTRLLPEPEYIPITGELPNVHSLANGASITLHCNAPTHFEFTETIQLNSIKTPTMKDPKYTLESVRQFFDLEKLTPYTDPSLSHERFFPSNLTHYFYERRGKKLVPRSYDSIIGTNLNGFKVRVAKYNNNSPNYAAITLELPASGILVIKDPGVYTVTLNYLCGAISPKRGLKRGLTYQTRSVTRSSGGANEGHDATKYKDWRAMEGWGISSVQLFASDPYVNGCGMTEPKEDIFRPDTEYFRNRHGKKAGCIVDLNVQKKAGFYCPYPYNLLPKECFDEVILGGTSISIRIGTHVRGLVPSKTSNIRYIEKVSDETFKTVRVIFNGRNIFECKCINEDGHVLSSIRVVV